MLSIRQPENWLYEIWQKGQENPCYVVVPNAKDLVKSHLMIAVREEVEVLKEKISELMDKINQLEVENTILKTNMSQESIQQLQMQTQLQIAASSATKASAKPAAIVDGSTLAAAAMMINAGANVKPITAAATPQSNVTSGTATPTSQGSVHATS